MRRTICALLCAVLLAQRAEGFAVTGTASLSTCCSAKHVTQKSSLAQQRRLDMATAPRRPQARVTPAAASIKKQLLAVAAQTDRGASMTKEQFTQIKALIDSLAKGVLRYKAAQSLQHAQVIAAHS